MKRADLESKVRIRWEAGSSGFSEVCVGRLVLEARMELDTSYAGVLDSMQAAQRIVVGDLVHAVIGDLEAENTRLRANLKKWGLRAISRQLPTFARDAEQAGEEGELKEDLK